MVREGSQVHCPPPPASTPPGREARTEGTGNKPSQPLKILAPPASEGHHLIAPRKELKKHKQVASRHQNVGANYQFP